VQVGERALAAVEGLGVVPVAILVGDEADLEGAPVVGEGVAEVAGEQAAFGESGITSSWLSTCTAIMAAATSMIGRAMRKRLTPLASTATSSRWRTSWVTVKPIAPASTRPSRKLKSCRSRGHQRSAMAKMVTRPSRRPEDSALGVVHGGGNEAVEVDRQVDRDDEGEEQHQQHAGVERNWRAM